MARMAQETWNGVNFVVSFNRAAHKTAINAREKMAQPALDWYYTNLFVGRVGPFPYQVDAWAATLSSGVPLDGSMVWCEEKKTKARAGKEVMAIINEYKRGFIERTGTEPIISYSRHTRLAKLLHKGRAISDAMSIAYEFGVRPPQWNIKSGATGFDSILRAAPEIMERMRGKQTMTPDEEAFLHDAEERAND